MRSTSPPSEAGVVYPASYAPVVACRSRMGCRRATLASQLTGQLRLQFGACKVLRPRVRQPCQSRSSDTDMPILQIEQVLDLLQQRKQPPKQGPLHVNPVLPWQGS